MTIAHPSGQRHSGVSIPVSRSVWLALAAVCATTWASLPGRGAAPAGNESALSREAIEAAIAEAQATDVDVTVQSALLYRGLILAQDESYAEAIPFLEEALRMDPSLQSGWEALGWSYIKTDKLEKAYDLWESFKELMPDQWMPYNLLAQLHILRHNWREADANFKEALGRKPDLFDLRFWYAQNLLRIGEPKEAEKVLRQLIKEEPDRLDIQIVLSQLLTFKLEYDEAADIMRRVNRELPDNAGFMLDQAVLELRVGELKRADQLCLDVLALEPENQRAMTLRADIAVVADMGEQSVKRLTEVIEATPDATTRARLRLDMANRCHLLNQRAPGSYSTAFILGEISKALEENPDDANACMLYAERLFQARRFEECKQWAIKVLEEHNRHNIRAKMLLFELALIERRFEDADRILHDRYANFDPKDLMRYYYEARLLAAEGSYREALQRLDKMEAIAQQGAVLTLLYHDLTESDWMPVTSVRRLYEHIAALKREGFTFISPAEIPDKLALAPSETRADPEIEESVPWTALFIDYIRYGITGERKFKHGRKVAPPPPPPKFAAVTFDDGLRSAFSLGAPLAEELGVPFGMFAITQPFKDYVPSIAGWDEISEYAASGAWVIGSHLYYAHEPAPTDAEGIKKVAPLPNRLWVPEKSRQESMNEWDRRMRREFRESRDVLRRELRHNDSEVPMVAYPYGDIGQESSCNLPLLRNPAQSIASEASRSYKVGFVQGSGGYTVAGDNLLLSRRYEPDWADEGADVVRHAYEFHPVFMARRTRVEIAFMMNKPHLARRMLELLKRDGYPEELCRQISGDVRSFFRNTPKRETQPLVSSSLVAVESAAGGGRTTPTHSSQSPLAMSAPMPVSVEDSEGDAEKRHSAISQTSGFYEQHVSGKYREGAPDPWVSLAHPFAGAEISHSQANDQFRILRAGGRGGLHLNRNLQLSGEYFESRIRQRIRPRWNAIYYDLNDTDSYIFKALKREARARLTYRTSGGITLSGSLGMARLRPRRGSNEEAEFYFEDRPDSGEFAPMDDDTEVIGDLSAYWAPRDELSIYVFYARDLVTSAIKTYTSDSVGGIFRYKPRDTWIMNLRSQYWSYQDENALFHIQGDSYWELLSDLGLWWGLDLSTITSSHASDYYWTPYWDQRLLGVLRYLQVWQGYNFRFDLLGGLQRENARPLRRSDDADLSSKSDWELAWGASATYNKRLNSYCDLFIDGNVMALRNYVDHRFLIGFNLSF